MAGSFEMGTFIVVLIIMKSWLQQSWSKYCETPNEMNGDQLKALNAHTGCAKVLDRNIDAMSH